MQNHKRELLEPQLAFTRLQISQLNISYLIVFASFLFGLYSFYAILIDRNDIHFFSKLIISKLSSDYETIFYLLTGLSTLDEQEQFLFENRVKFMAKVSFWIGLLTFMLVSLTMIARTLLCQMVNNIYIADSKRSVRILFVKKIRGL